MQRRSFFGVVFRGFLGALSPWKWRPKYYAVAIADEYFTGASLIDWMRDHDDQKSIIHIDADGVASWVKDEGKPASGQLLVQLADEQAALEYGSIA